MLESWMYALALGTGLALPIRADLVTNLNPLADTSLLETLPDNNLGGLTDVPVGTTPMGRSRGLFKFDLTSLPANATILSVTVTLTVTKLPSPAVGSVFALNRVLVDWGEGNGAGAGSGAMATAGEATWNERFYAETAWQSPGAAAGSDYVATFSVTNFIDALGSYTFASSPGLVADVQSWVGNPGTNFGWMLLTQDEGTVGTVRRFATREDPIQTPVVTVQYTTPPLLLLSTPALAGNQVQFSFQAQANQSYTVEYRSALASGNWQTLTNIPALPSAGTVGVTDVLVSSNRFYRIRTP